MWYTCYVLHNIYYVIYYIITKAWTVVFEKTLESPLDCKEIQPVHPKGNLSWVFIGRTDAEAETLNTLATPCEELIHWKRPWCWEGLGAGGEGDDKGRDGWMASPTWWTWVWVNSGSWWWTGRPGMLWFMGSQRVGHDWATELNWTSQYYINIYISVSWSSLFTLGSIQMFNLCALLLYCYSST